MRFFQFLFYLIVRTLCATINLIPYSLAQNMGKTFGKIGYYLMFARRNIALNNLRNAYRHKKTERELRLIARKSFENLVIVFIEFIRIPKLAKNFFSYVTIENSQTVWDGLKKGKGVILLISHYGNWELMAIMAGKIGYPISAVGRPMKNPYIYAYIERLRQFSGLKSLNKKGAAKEILRELKSNKVVAILFDQYAGRSGAKTLFFGQPALTTTAVAQLAIHTGAQVIPAFNVRQNDGSHIIYVDSPINTVITSDKQHDILVNTQNYNTVLEKWIDKNPHLWFWFHKRWKTPRENTVS